MGITSFFGFRALAVSDESELPEIFPLNVVSSVFVQTDVLNVYSKILTDCIERTQGIPEEVFPLLWDNCLQSEANHGLITHLAIAMVEKKDLFLVYDPAISLLRVADDAETQQIRLDYKKQGESSVGVFVSFKHYHRTDMIKIYSAMEYCVVASLNKMMNLSKAIQYKMSDMRSSVSLNDKEIAVEQAKSMAMALRNGKDIMMDQKDEVTTNTPDITSIKESILFLDSKRAFYYCMPLSYITGEQTGGIGSTGEGDMKAVERGLKQYFISIIKPVLEAIFDITVTFKSNDFRQIGSALEALKTFDLVSDNYITQDEKKIIIQRLLDLDPEVGGE